MILFLLEHEFSNSIQQQSSTPQKQNFQSAAHQNLAAVRLIVQPRLLIAENDTSYKSNIYKNRMI